MLTVYLSTYWSPTCLRVDHLPVDCLPMYLLTVYPSTCLPVHRLLVLSTCWQSTCQPVYLLTFYLSTCLPVDRLPVFLFTVYLLTVFLCIYLPYTCQPVFLCIYLPSTCWLSTHVSIYRLAVVLSTCWPSTYLPVDHLHFNKCSIHFFIYDVFFTIVKRKQPLL